MLIPQIRGRGAPIVMGISGVGQGVSEGEQPLFRQPRVRVRVKVSEVRIGLYPSVTDCLYKPVRYLLRFCCSFEVKFWFPQFGGRGTVGTPMEMGLRGVIWGVSDFIQIALQSL